MFLWGLGAKKDWGTGFLVFCLYEKQGKSQKTKEGGGGGGGRKCLQTIPWILKTSIRQRTGFVFGCASWILLTCFDQRTSTSEAFQGCLQKALTFLTELTDKVFHKTALHGKRCTCCVCKPNILETQRLLSFSFLWGFRVLHCCGTADSLGFRHLHIISEANAFTSGSLSIFRYFSRLLLFSSQMFEAFPAQIPMFSEKMFHCLILSQAITLKLICGLGFFPLACSANAPLLDVRSWLASLTLYQYTVI